MISQQQSEEYQALWNGKGFTWHDDRTLLRLAGPDAAKFLHNFCTADVKAMQVGESKEAFVLDSRGKTISFGHAICFKDEVYWSAANKAHAATLREHFDKYIIREDVEVEDLSNLWQMAIAPLGEDNLAEGEFGRFEKEDGLITGFAELAGDCAAFLCESSKVQMPGPLSKDNYEECSVEALNILRLEAGTPWFGCEVNDDNLPQELRRDDKAISFTKGCYLGQETVAKIDAIGHVNRFLVGLKLTQNAEPAAEISDDGKKVGELKSVVWSPTKDGLLGLGFVKRQHAKAGTMLAIADKSVEVVTLPIER